MPEIYPFKALLPAPGLENEVSANTHVDDKKRQMEIIQTNPSTYLQVVKPYLKFDEEKNPDKHFPLSKQAIDRLIADKTMVQDTVDTLYVYLQLNKENNQQYLGLICNVSAKDYYDDKIKVHENTLTEKENQLIDHIRICGAIGEPVLLTHFANTQVESLLNLVIENQVPDIDFTDEVNRQHTIYKVQSLELIADFNKAYQTLANFYIADGHHRSAASAGYYHKAGVENGKYLAFLVPANHLHIDSFYRAYKSDNPFNANDFIENLKSHFEISEASNMVVPKAPKTFGLCTSAGWFNLKFKGTIDSTSAVNTLDVSILEAFVFREKLHIADSKTDHRLTYIKGNTPIQHIDDEVKKGTYDVVFTVYPCDIEEVFKIADQGLIMPPKSTYIEPKLRTGLTVQLV